MPYHLLTGATGLLGGYLLRDCFRRDISLAVVVRPSRRFSPRERIEALMSRWESLAGRALPRPVVLEGDLSQPRLGLDDDQIRWVGENCESVIHNAASLSFVATRDGEPHRSNVDGTRNMLQLCQAAGIATLHHVSTAYVCGRRSDLVLESELNVGQEMGNVYEDSKLQSETMVREAGMDSLTIYRPAIIVGDSADSFTSTYHGFYSPLRVAHSLVGRLRLDLLGVNLAGGDLGSFGQGYGKTLLDLFQLTGQERKNFVPVDWVSEVMVEILARPSQHGRVYHLTPAERVPLTTMTDIMLETVLEQIRQTGAPQASNGRGLVLTDFQDFFRDQLRVYESYWRDDPEFDRTNLLDAVGHLPCPQVDAAMLRRLCRFAVAENFGMPAKKPELPERDIHRHLAERIPGPRRNGAHRRAESAGFLGLQVNGPGGGQWELEVHDGRVATVRPGVTARCTALLYMNAQTFGRLCRRDIDAGQSIRVGDVLVTGNGLPLSEISDVLATLTGEA